MSRSSGRAAPPCLTSRAPSRSLRNGYVDQLFLDRLHRAILAEEQQAAALERQVRELRAQAKKGDLFLDRLRRQIAAREDGLRACSDLNRLQAYESKKRYLNAKVAELKTKAVQRLQLANDCDRKVASIKTGLVVARPGLLKSAAKKKHKRGVQGVKGRALDDPSSSSSRSDF